MSLGLLSVFMCDLLATYSALSVVPAVSCQRTGNPCPSEEYAVGDKLRGQLLGSVYVSKMPCIVMEEISNRILTELAHFDNDVRG